MHTARTLLLGIVEQKNYFYLSRFFYFVILPKHHHRTLFVEFLYNQKNKSLSSHTFYRRLISVFVSTKRLVMQSAHTYLACQTSLRFLLYTRTSSLELLESHRRKMTTHHLIRINVPLVIHAHFRGNLHLATGTHSYMIKRRELTLIVLDYSCNKRRNTLIIFGCCCGTARRRRTSTKT